MRYRIKTNPIDVFKFDGNNCLELSEFSKCGVEMHPREWDSAMFYDKRSLKWVTIRKNEYVVKNLSDGSFETFSEQEFLSKFEAVGDEN